MKIVVAGATGALGSCVMDAVRIAGHEPVPISRSSGVDLMTGAGLAPALAGATAVIDASATSTTSTKQFVDFFGTVTRNLLAAERAAEVPHHVAISIIGAAKVNANYYAGKAAQEQILQAVGGGWSLLRTTQFHDFAKQLVGHGKVGPWQVVPTMRSQPIAATEVATELVAIACGEPRGLEPDLAGPREENMADLVRRYLAAIGRSRPVIQVPLPGAWGRSMRDGTLLPARGTRRARVTFDEWLTTQSGPTS
ncbi:SDR family oxidoreductase [Microbacterium protaetiae]|uniref:SDR family oxidoreductase n=1 Tax=Microbacterium protaetiae TaxID=2509458 RepID=A0A4P6E9K8_9MICO|nr:SDR family oxidoreductase [Microbacterium protaetiae]QAY58584.1 SDR family oxidoreductase [Microbacterium protaetiae]